MWSQSEWQSDILLRSGRRGRAGLREKQESGKSRSQGVKAISLPRQPGSRAVGEVLEEVRAAEEGSLGAHLISTLATTFLSGFPLPLTWSPGPTAHGRPPTCRPTSGGSSPSRARNSLPAPSQGRIPCESPAWTSPGRPSCQLLSPLPGCSFRPPIAGVSVVTNTGPWPGNDKRKH